MNLRRWSDDEFARAIIMKRQGLDANEIAERLGRSTYSVIGKFHSAGFAAPTQRKEDRISNPPRGEGINNSGAVQSRVSAAQLAEREARAQARARQSLTGETFGDPPPGYSALDRLKAREGARS